MSKHLKRLAAPRALHVHRKERVWTAKSAPGPHPLERSIPLALALRDYLGLCDTYKEANRIIANGEAIVDGAPRRDHKYALGLMDVLSIPSLKKDYRVLFNQRGKLTLVPIASKDAGWKLCRIENKTMLKGKKTQLNMHDGRNILADKDEYSTGDVVKLSFKDKKISEVIKFEKGIVSLIIGGSHIGEIADITDIEAIASSKSNLAKMKGTSEFSTLQEYVFPIGKTKPIIALPEVKVQ